MFREIQQCKIHFERLGQGEKKVVLLHGWGCSIGTMRPVAAALESDHQILIPDFPAHGESGKPPEPWGIPEFASCLKELLKEESFIPCAVVAHSFGARVAAYLAAEDENLFTRIVLTGAAGLKAPVSEEAKKKNLRYRREKEAVKKLEKIPGLGRLSGRLEEGLVQRYGSADYKALDPEMRKTFVRVIGMDLSDCYPRIRQSTLLIWGDRDTETPLWMGQKMEQLIPDAGLVVFEGGSHFAYAEQIGRFNTILRNFL